MSRSVEDNCKPEFDTVIATIAEYVLNPPHFSLEAYETARLCLLDTLGCGILALNFAECRKLLGPVVPGALLVNGARVPGTNFELDPVQAAFNIGTMVRWLDFNDTWLAAEWGHPSDNLGAILAVMDYLNRQKKAHFTMRDVLTAMIKAHEIQGGFALENSFNRVGLDHVLLVKLASAAVTAQLLGGDRDQIMRTISQVFVDGQSLRTYRHAPNAGSRKSWAAGDATSRAVRLALIAATGEMGYPSALTVPEWGFYAVLFANKRFSFQRPFTDYVMENILFKLSFPAEFHAQTAVECAVILHSELIKSFDDLERVDIITHESAIRIISKQGPLHNPADRDHCLQYMVAVALLFGNLKAEHYEDATASDPRIDALRALMHVSESKQCSKDYLDSNKRSIANSIQLIYKNGEKSALITVEYPIGHKRRRAEGIPVLLQKFDSNLATCFEQQQIDTIKEASKDVALLSALSVDAYLDLWVTKTKV